MYNFIDELERELKKSCEDEYVLRKTLNVWVVINKIIDEQEKPHLLTDTLLLYNGFAYDEKNQVFYKYIYGTTRFLIPVNEIPEKWAVERLEDEINFKREIEKWPIPFFRFQFPTDKCLPCFVLNVIPTNADTTTINTIL